MTSGHSRSSHSQLLVQAGPRDPALPVAHALLHRTAIEHLGYVSPPGTPPAPPTPT